MKALWASAMLVVATCAPPADDDSESANASEPATDNLAASVPASREPAPVESEAPKPAPAAVEVREPYTARGQEPGWALTIDKGRIDYQGDYGEKLINVARPEPQAIANGRRYATDRLTVTITFTRCNDAMSGHGYEHEVNVTADGEKYDGCGGPRRTDWDM